MLKSVHQAVVRVPVQHSQHFMTSQCLNLQNFFIFFFTVLQCHFSVTAEDFPSSPSFKRIMPQKINMLIFILPIYSHNRKTILEGGVTYHMINLNSFLLLSILHKNQIKHYKLNCFISISTNLVLI